MLLVCLVFVFQIFIPLTKIKPPVVKIEIIWLLVVHQQLLRPELAMLVGVALWQLLLKPQFGIIIMSELAFLATFHHLLFKDLRGFVIIILLNHRLWPNRRNHINGISWCRIQIELLLRYLDVVLELIAWLLPLCLHSAEFQLLSFGTVELYFIFLRKALIRPIASIDDIEFAKDHFLGLNLRRDRRPRCPDHKLSCFIMLGILGGGTNHLGENVLLIRMFHYY